MILPVVAPVFRISARLAVSGLLALVVGCGAQAGQPGSEAGGHTTKHTVKRTTTSVTRVTAAPVPITPAPEPVAVEPEPVGDAITASASLRELCGIDASITAPRFEVGKSRIMSADNDLFNAIASCVEDGKLGDEKLHVIGFTDPRGSEELNMKLGRDRANAARAKLTALGVGNDKLQAESRGESEATGTDEPTWARDRRVEIRLDREMNPTQKP